MDIKVKPPSQAEESFIPNFCDVNFILRLLVVTELMAIVLSLNSSPLNEQLWDKLSITSLFMLWIALTSAALLCSLGSLLKRLSNIAASIVSYLLVLMVTLGLYRAFQRTHPAQHCRLSLINGLRYVLK